MRLARLALLRDDLEEAHRHNDLAADLYREAGDTWGEATTESNRGDFALVVGEPGAALRHMAAAIDRYLAGGFVWYAATRLDTVGACFTALDRPRDAAAAFGAADAWLDALAMPHNPMTAQGRPVAEAAARTALGDRFAGAAARGARWPRDRVGLARRLR